MKSWHRRMPLVRSDAMQSSPMAVHSLFLRAGWVADDHVHDVHLTSPMKTLTHPRTSTARWPCWLAYRWQRSQPVVRIAALVVNEARAPLPSASCPTAVPASLRIPCLPLLLFCPDAVFRAWLSWRRCLLQVASPARDIFSILAGNALSCFRFSPVRSLPLFPAQVRELSWIYCGSGGALSLQIESIRCLKLECSGVWQWVPDVGRSCWQVSWRPYYMHWGTLRPRIYFSGGPTAMLSILQSTFLPTVHILFTTNRNCKWNANWQLTLAMSWAVIPALIFENHIDHSCETFPVVIAMDVNKSLQVSCQHPILWPAVSPGLVPHQKLLFGIVAFNLQSFSIGSSGIELVYSLMSFNCSHHPCAFLSIRILNGCDTASLLIEAHLLKVSKETVLALLRYHIYLLARPGCLLPNMHRLAIWEISSLVIGSH